MRSSTLSLDMTIGNAGSACAAASLNDHNATVTIADGSFKSISRDCGVQIWRVSLLPADKQYDNGIRTQTPDVCTQHPFKPGGNRSLPITQRCAAPGVSRKTATPFNGPPASRRSSARPSVCQAMTCLQQNSLCRKTPLTLRWPCEPSNQGSPRRDGSRNLIGAA